MNGFRPGCVLSVCLVCGWASGDTITVPDDVGTIQEAIQGAKSGDVVVIKPGTYDTPIILKEDVSVRGEGSVVLRVAHTRGPVVTVLDCSECSVSGLTLEHAEVEGDLEEAEVGPVLSIVNSTVDILDCVIQNASGNGIYIEGPGMVHVEKCTVSGNGGDGIHVNSGGASAKFVGNTVEENGRHGIYFYFDTKGNATENTCSKNGLDGIHVHGVKARPKVENNVCSENERDGIGYTYHARGRATGNRSLSNGRNGLTVYGLGTKPEVRENEFRDNLHYGFWVHEESKPKVRDNDFTKNEQISREEIKRLFDEDRFQELETIAVRLREDEMRFPSGEWQLPFFYTFPTDNCRAMEAAAEIGFFAKLKAWRELFPESIVPLVIEGDACIEFAWRERGNGWASTVSTGGWRGFEKYLKQAEVALTKATKLDPNAPESYPGLITVSMGIGEPYVPSTVERLGGWFKGLIGGPPPSRDMTPTATKAIMTAALKVEPQYYSLYYKRLTMLLPRWGGAPGALEDFAKQAAADTADTEGYAMYARIASSAISMVHSEHYLRAFEFSWPNIQQGFIDLLDQFPDSNYRLNCYALFACIYDDRDLAKQLFERIGDDWDNGAWYSDARFKTWKDWVDGKIDFPVENKLCAAVSKGSIGDVADLLRMKSNPDSADENGMTALNHAVQNQDETLVRMLLDAGADPNYRGHMNFAPFHRAIRTSKISMAELFLEHGADVDQITLQGETAIGIASRFRMQAKLDFLLEQDPDVTIANASRWAPLHYAAKHNHPKLVEALMERGANTEALLEDDWTALHIACDAGSIDAIRALIEHGANIDARLVTGSTPLKIAREKQNKELIALLESKGATR